MFFRKKGERRCLSPGRLFALGGRAALAASELCPLIANRELNCLSSIPVYTNIDLLSIVERLAIYAVVVVDAIDAYAVGLYPRITGNRLKCAPLAKIKLVSDSAVEAHRSRAYAVVVSNAIAAILYALSKELAHNRQALPLDGSIRIDAPNGMILITVDSLNSIAAGSIAEVSFKGNRFTLLKPSTYMNLSGKAVRYWMGQLKLPIGQLLVISDDLNLPFGSLRLRKNGSAGGHNGLANITEMLGSQDYARLRIGIGNNFSRGGQIDFVLGDLTREETAELPEICSKAIEGVKTFASAGIDRAMNMVNTKAKSAK